MPSVISAASSLTVHRARLTDFGKSNTGWDCVFTPKWNADNQFPYGKWAVADAVIDKR